MNECSICVNESINPCTQIGKDGLCEVCRGFQANFDDDQRRIDLGQLKSFIGSGRYRYDVLVGMSGGKDSSCAALKLKELGFDPLGFTFDIGYYPPHIFSRAKEMADRIGISHVRINIRHQISPAHIESYRLTEELYDRKYREFLDFNSVQFIQQYVNNRENYSVKYSNPMAYARTCILCRKIVIPSYHQQALMRGIKLVVLGMNEWASLSKETGIQRLSGIRKLRPPGCDAVYVAHLPFILGLKKADVQSVLQEIGWTQPDGESFVESNANSCLLAAAAEDKAIKMLGFHPDITRLAREVTVGFITKEEAKQALQKDHGIKYSVADVLKEAQISQQYYRG